MTIYLGGHELETYLIAAVDYVGDLLEGLGYL